MLEDRDIRQIREIIAREIYDAIREQMPKFTGDLVTDRELRRQLDALEDRIVRRVQS